MSTRIPRSALAAALLLAATPPAPAQQAPHLLDADVAALLHEELSGELAKEHVIAITRHHRIQGSRGYRDAAHYVLDQLRGFGFDETRAWIESFPSDGRVTYQTWQSPSGWDIESAELRMVAPFDERIVGYPEVAMSVVTYSNPGDVTAPLVFAGRGTSDADYEGKDVAGAFVLATGYGGSVHREAVIERGAAGVVCYLDDDRAREYPDMLAYTGMWPRSEELDRVTFGFNLTNRQGERLRALLDDGEEVVLHGRVEGIGLEPYFMDVVVAIIEGTDRRDEELVFTAHLDHPKESANDNASGSGALLDVARGLSTLIESGRLPRPRRTLRFLWVPEFFGTMAYLDAHAELEGPALGGKVLANLNMDMVGENTELLHCRLELTRSPASIPSTVNDVVADMAALVDGLDVRTPRGSLAAMNYRVTPYAPGSDHMIFIDRKVPGIMMWHTPDYTHHTSEDTPDKVDPVELERCEILAAGAMLELANLDRADAVDLVWHTASAAHLRLGEAGRRARSLVETAPDAGLAVAWGEAQNVLDYASQWRIQEIRSVLDFHDDEVVRRAIAQAAGALSGHWSALQADLRDQVAARGLTDAAPPTVPAEPDGRVPIRLTRGPLANDLLERQLPPERYDLYATDGPGGIARFEIVNFMDDERSVADLRNAVSAEFGPVDPAAVSRFVEDLEAIGVVTWR